MANSAGLPCNTIVMGYKKMLQPALMMNRPLLISDVIEHAAAQFGGVPVVSRETHGPLFRYTYAECAARAPARQRAR